MKNILKIALVIMAVIMLGGCRKVSDNGLLDGQWKIMRIESNTRYEITPPDTQRYIAFNLHMVMLIPSRLCGNIVYDKEGKTLVMDFPYARKPQTEDEDASLYQWELRQHGILANPDKFNIEKLDSKQLVLHSQETGITIYCRRF